MNAATGDAQSDVMSGATIALMVLFVALMLYLFVLLAAVTRSAEDLDHARAALIEEAEARTAADAARDEARSARATSERRLAAAQREQTELAAKAKAAAAERARYADALREAAGRDLGAGEVQLLADLREARQGAADLAQRLEDAASEATRRQAELTRAEQRSEALERDVAAARAEARTATARAEALEAQAAGEREGNLVATGTKIWVNGEHAIITDAEPVGWRWKKRWDCTLDERWLSSGGGGGYSGGTPVGR